MTLRIYENGVLYWQDEKSRLHRENGPALISPSGQIQYHYKDKLHRDDGPAVIKPNGTREYWNRGTYLYALPKSYNYI